MAGRACAESRGSFAGTLNLHLHAREMWFTAATSFLSSFVLSLSLQPSLSGKEYVIIIP